MCSAMEDRMSEPENPVLHLLQEIRADIAALKSDMGSLKPDVAALEADVAALEARAEQRDDEMSVMIGMMLRIAGTRLGSDHRDSER
jgi:predicted  nucleic acid-binding Zn-ribbon protein